MSEKLKPCPFCGGKGGKQTLGKAMLGGVYWTIACMKCHCTTAGYMNVSNAVKAWNRRVNDENID